MQNNTDNQQFRMILQQAITKFLKYKETHQQHEQFLNENSLLQLPVSNPQDFINLLQNKFKQLHYFISTILEQSINLLQKCSLQEQLSKRNKTTLQDTINKLKQQNSTKNQEITTLNAKDENKQIIIQQLQEKILQLKLKIEHIDASYAIQKKQLIQSHKQELRTTELDIDAVKQLKQQNNNLMKEILEVKQIKEDLEGTMIKKQKELQVLQQQIIKLKGLLDWQKQKKQQSNKEYQMQEERIKCLEEEIQSLGDALRNPFQQLTTQEMQYFISPEQQRQLKKQDSQFNKLQSSNKQSLIQTGNKLSEETAGIKLDDSEVNLFKDKEQYNSPEKSPQLKKTASIKNDQIDVFESPKSISRNFKIANIHKKLKMPPLDPYYCHFTLLSQSIKIRENNEKFFNLDVKPYYKSIIDDKIPMHQWGQWILEKFQQLALQSAKTPQQNKKEQQINNIAENRKIVPKIIHNLNQKVQSNEGIQLQQSPQFNK